MKISEALEILNKNAPYSLAEDWDNSGFLIGKRDTEITKILISLDFTPDVLIEAIENSCNLIVTHHPYIFKGFNRITDETIVGSTALRLIESNISLICAHTNLDAAYGGVNDTLCKTLGIKVIPSSEESTICRVGIWNKPLSYVIERVKSELNASVRISFSDDVMIKKVAVCSGSGCEFLEFAKRNNCDMLLTSDAKYHDFQRAAELGIILLDAGHFETENIICPVISRMFDGVETIISKKHKGFYKTI